MKRLAAGRRWALGLLGGKSVWSVLPLWLPHLGAHLKHPFCHAWSVQEEEDQRMVRRLLQPHRKGEVQLSVLTMQRQVWTQVKPRGSGGLGFIQRLAHRLNKASTHCPGRPPGLCMALVGVPLIGKPASGPGSPAVYPLVSPWLQTPSLLLKVGGLCSFCLPQTPGRSPRAGGGGEVPT